MSILVQVILISCRLSILYFREGWGSLFSVQYYLGQNVFPVSWIPTGFLTANKEIIHVSWEGLVELEMTIKVSTTNGNSVFLCFPQSENQAFF